MGKSPPIKAGHRESLLHLTSTLTGINTSLGRSMRPSAGPERSQLLRILPSLTVRQFFSVSAYFFLPQHWRAPLFCGRLVFHAPMFFMCQCFVDANNLSTPIICQRLSFVCANVLSTPILSTPKFYVCQCLCIFYLYFCVFFQRLYFSIRQ